MTSGTMIRPSAPTSLGVRSGRTWRLPGRWPLRRLWHTFGVPIQVAANIAQCTLIVWRHYRRNAGGSVYFLGRSRALGDLIALEPLARELRARHPGNTVAWLVEPAFAPVLALFPTAPEVVKVPCKTSLPILARLFGRRRVLVMHFEGLRCPLCYLPVKARPIGKHIGLANYYADGRTLLEAFGATAGITPTLRRPTLVRPPLSELGLRPEVVVHVSPSDPSRTWPAASWHRFLSSLLDRFDVHVTLVGLHNPTGIRHSRCADRTGRQSVVELAATIAAARLYIGVDSGPAHLANAYEIPAVLLLGRWLGFAEYQPFTGFYEDPAHLRVVRSSQTVADIVVEDVLRAFEASWSQLESASRATLAATPSMPNPRGVS